MVFGGVPAEVMRLAISQDIQMISCEQLLAELERVLRRPKMMLLEVDVDIIVDTIKDSCQIAIIDSVTPIISEDPDDDIVLECAKASNADHIITGDDHLLKLERYHHTTIITPSQFLAIKE